MVELEKVLGAMVPLMDQIATISGVPGFSVGVFHEGDVVFRHNYGYRDLELQLPTTSRTIYPTASLSKAFTESINGTLVAQGHLDWHSPIRRVLPEFHSISEEIGSLTSAVDLLAHRTGVPGGETLCFHAQPLLNDSGIIPTFASIPPKLPFRTRMHYNNLGYGIIAMMMSRYTGKSYDELLHERLIRPLNLKRTGLTFDPGITEDVAKTYIVTKEREAIENTRPLFLSGSSMSAAGGVYSSIDDLLVFYRELLKEAFRGTVQPDGAPKPSPFKELATIMTGHIFMDSQRTTLLEQTYGLG